MHKSVKLRELFRCVVGHSAEVAQLGSGDHRAVDKHMSAGKERIEQFEFQSRWGICEHNMQMSVGDELPHGMVVGIGHEPDIVERSEAVADYIGRIASCNHKVAI